jgi:hypothetical protein
MADTFSFAGRTIVAPGVLVETNIDASIVFELLPFGVLAFFGAADGGAGNGTVYQFQDLNVAARLLRAGPLLDALNRAGAIGGASGFVAVVMGAKTPATLALAGAAEAAATLTSGDQGDWNNQITVEIVAGTAPDSVAFLFSYVDQNGNVVYLGGVGTAFDNIKLFSQLQAVMARNTLMTPPLTTGFPPLLTLTVATDGLPTIMPVTNLAGGHGGGNQDIAFADVKTAVDGALTTPFDIGHLVEVYDAPSQVYADAQAALVSAYGNLRRFIHQTRGSAIPAQTLVQNSLATVNGGIAAANALDSIRSSVFCQRIAYANPKTGLTQLVDVAPFICGMAALIGATGPWGPASPLTFEIIPGATGVDYEVLSTTGDRDNAVIAGVCVLDQIGTGKNARVRIVQSLTTAPTDGNGDPWIFSEFSVVRVSDAVLANVKAKVLGPPKSIGGGNTNATMLSILADIRDVLEDALLDSWITAFDSASITIYTTGATGMDDIVSYDMAPTLPLNHLGVTQNLLPYSASVSLGGTVSG